MKGKSNIQILAVSALLVGLTACVKPVPPERIVREVEIEENKVPGTIDEVWVEPMFDVTRVPGKLDPKGTYYRAEHKTVVEIRPGKYQVQEFPRGARGGNE